MRFLYRSIIRWIAWLETWLLASSVTTTEWVLSSIELRRKALAWSRTCMTSNSRSTESGASPIPILYFAMKQGKITDLGAGRESFVTREALVGIGDIFIRNKGGDVEPEDGVRLFFHHLALEALDGLFHHLHVQIESDGRDMPRLLFPEEVAGASDFHIRRSDAETGAQFGELLNGREALLGVFAQLSLIGDQEVGVGLVAASSDSPAQLVQLREAEHVGAIDEDRVGMGHVDARLDNGRGDQHIRLSAKELQHHGFERFGVHLPMGHHDARVGHQLLEPGSRLLHRFDPVMDEVDLPAPPQFAQHRFSDECVARSDDLRANGQAAGRRCFDDREIAHARHGHLQGARDRRRRECQDVDLGAELLQAFLVFDAEPLFLVDDHETQVAEYHILLDEPVRADHHVDGSGCDVFENGFGLLRRLESGKQGHASRKRREPF